MVQVTIAIQLQGSEIIEDGTVCKRRGTAGRGDDVVVRSSAVLHKETNCSFQGECHSENLCACTSLELLWYSLCYIGYFECAWKSEKLVLWVWDKPQSCRFAWWNQTCILQYLIWFLYQSIKMKWAFGLRFQRWLQTTMLHARLSRKIFPGKLNYRTQCWCMKYSKWVWAVATWINSMIWSILLVWKRKVPLSVLNISFWIWVAAYRFAISLLGLPLAVVSYCPSSQAMKGQCRWDDSRHKIAVGMSCADYKVPPEQGPVHSLELCAVTYLHPFRFIGFICFHSTSLPYFQGCCCGNSASNYTPVNLLTRLQVKLGV